MLHHISFSVLDINKSSALYDAALRPLGYIRVCAGKDFVGYGQVENQDKFALKQRVDNVQAPSLGFHLAFAAPDRQAVDEFYHAAIAHGAICNGKPGLREHYGPHYYAAFLFDLDGYAIEAVING